MRCYDIYGWIKIEKGLPARLNPFPHITIGTADESVEENDKLAKKIPIRKEDLNYMIEGTTKAVRRYEGGRWDFRKPEYRGSAHIVRIDKIEILKIEEKLFVCKEARDKNKILVRWTVPSAYNGKSDIIGNGNILTKVRFYHFGNPYYGMSMQALIVLRLGDKINAWSTFSGMCSKKAFELVFKERELVVRRVQRQRPSQDVLLCCKV